MENNNNSEVETFFGLLNGLISLAIMGGALFVTGYVALCICIKMFGS